MKVLLIDDDPVIRRLAEVGLTRAGWIVAVACSGEEALAVVRDAAPEVILLDVVMPGMDGLETLAALRKQACTAPVIMMTARDDPADVAGYRASGAAAVINKPFDPIALPDLIARAVARPAPTFRQDPVSEVIAHLAAEYARALPGKLAELRAAADRAASAEPGDPAREDATRRAHRLRGTAGSYGFAAVGALCGQLESALREGDRERIRRELARLDALLAGEG